MMGDVRCPKCGRKTTIRTAKKDDCQYHVCINSPRCKGRVLVDEDQGDDWGEESPATETAQDEPRQRVAPHPSGRKVRGGVHRPERKGGVLADEDQGDDWGDDWDEERPATKAASGKYRQQIAPKADATPEKKKPARPRRRRVPQRYLIPERKKRSLAVIIIALIIAFLAIDGIIYAAFVLR